MNPAITEYWAKLGFDVKRRGDLVNGLPVRVKSVTARLGRKGMRGHILIDELLPRRKSESPEIRAILSSVCAKHRVNLRDLKSHDRGKHLTPARFEAYSRLRDLGLSYPRVGIIMGNRCHATIMSGVKKHKAELLNGK